jgi:formylglycine-generating enzyme required for sulfatase activity
MPVIPINYRIRDVIYEFMCFELENDSFLFHYFNNCYLDVKIPYTFSLGKTPVTEKQFKPFCKFINRSSKINSLWGYPAYHIDWISAIQYCYYLTILARIDGVFNPNEFFCLPTSIEWEYACRGGQSADFNDGTNTIGNVGWCRDNSTRVDEGRGSRLVNYQFVMKKRQNNYGFYDMHGLTKEWCHDTEMLDPVRNHFTYGIHGSQSSDKVVRGLADERATFWKTIFRQFGGNINGDNFDSAIGKKIDDLYFYLINPSKFTQAKRVMRGGSINDPMGHCKSGSTFSEDPKSKGEFPAPEIDMTAGGFHGFRLCISNL